MTERQKTVAQYLNGLAVAVIATVGGAALSGSLSPQFLILAGAMSALLHGVAILLSA